MRIFLTQSLPQEAPHGASFPCVFLCHDNWDDFGYKTTYHAVIFTAPKKILLSTRVKILKRNIDLPESEIFSTDFNESVFSQLPDEYCSLGSTMEYYHALKSLGPVIYTSFLTSMRDAAFLPNIGQLFEGLAGFKKSLLRSGSAEKAYREARALLNEETIEKTLSFSFACHIDGADAPHVVEMDFRPDPTNLHRTVVLIGRNGTGKTRFLAEFAQAMCGRTEAGRLSFSPRRPSFSRVITVSYSVFDDFDRPSEADENFSYKYCGIRTTGGSRGSEAFLSSIQLKANLRESINEIRGDAKRFASLRQIIGVLLEDAGEPSEQDIISFSLYENLSSGQKILVAIMTQIISFIRNDSIILFDEPELHLHPEVFAALARATDLLLKQHDSYAIIATHSALLLQETLSKQVRVFRRVGNTPIVTSLGLECFGENIATLTREVFSVDGSNFNFRAHLDELLKNRTPEQVESLFPEGLPVLARSYIYSKSNEGKTK